MMACFIKLSWSTHRRSLWEIRWYTHKRATSGFKGLFLFHILLIFTTEDTGAGPGGQGSDGITIIDRIGGQLLVVFVRLPTIALHACYSLLLVFLLSVGTDLNTHLNQPAHADKLHWTTVIMLGFHLGLSEASESENSTELELLVFYYCSFCYSILSIIFPFPVPVLSCFITSDPCRLYLNCIATSCHHPYLCPRLRSPIVWILHRMFESFFPTSFDLLLPSLTVIVAFI